MHSKADGLYTLAWETLQVGGWRVEGRGGGERWAGFPGVVGWGEQPLHKRFGAAFSKFHSECTTPTAAEILKHNQHGTNVKRAPTHPHRQLLLLLLLSLHVRQLLAVMRNSAAWAAIS